MPDIAVAYTILPTRPEAHIFRVTCSVAQPNPRGQVFMLPAWIPGSYMIRDFSRNIIELNAFCGDETIACHKLDKQTWCCAPCAGPLTLQYEVYAWDLSVRAAHLDTSHGYFNGTSVFLCALGHEGQACSVEIQPPPGGSYAEWRVATALSRDGAALYGFGRYRAQDYDELVDHPVEMGTFDLCSFEVAGVPHDLVVTGRHRADLPRIARDVQQICARHVALFGELPPMERYVFQVMAVGEGYGGLEHRASTSLLCSRYDLPRAGETDVSERYRGFLGLCSHEYFHTWNVKRIKPAAFVPYDLSQEVYTRLLWMFEGITSYYDDLALVRCGLIPAESYLELLGQMITRVLRTPGRFRQSVADSSFDAWTKFYKQDENAPNAIVSYYAKGAIIALALDLHLRHETNGRVSLDDVMRHLWRHYGKPGVGVSETGIEAEIGRIAGLDLQDFFQRYVHGTEDPPLAELLQTVGVDYCQRYPESDQDKGGKPGQAGQETRAAASLGVLIKDEPAGVRVTHVLEGGSAQWAGIAAGDLLIALDGLRLTAKELDARVRSYAVGEIVTAHVFRRDELLELAVNLVAAVEDTCVLSLPRDNPAAKERARTWLQNV